MTRIGLLSDTHGFWDERFADYFAEVDEIWHVGDIGTVELADRLAALHPIKAVHGNIDGSDLRLMFPEKLRFKCEEVDILMKHIGGYPGHYDRSIAGTLKVAPPTLFISGHSHILKVQFDPQLHLLHINPGAAGVQGWQHVRTLVRFNIDGKEIKDLEVVELN